MPSTTNSSTARRRRWRHSARVAAVDDELADQGVVVGRDRVALVDRAIDADADAAGRVVEADLAGRGREGLRVLGVDADFDGVAVERDLVLGQRQGFARGDLDLLVDDVDAGDALGDRVLDLDAGVHLDEVELAVLVEELDGAGARVFELAHGGGADLADLAAAWRRDGRGGGLLPDLLVAALQRAVAGAEMDGVALAVAHQLDFDVARLLQVLFDVDAVVAEGGLGLGARGR